MHTRIIIFFTLLFQVSFAKALPTAKESEEYSVSPFAESVALRMCCIARIGPIIKFLKQIKMRLYDQQALQLLDDELFEQWNDFNQFHFIADSTFHYTLLKKVFEVLYILSQKKNSDFFYGYDQKMIVYWFDDLTQFISEFESTKTSNDIQDSDNFEYLPSSINTNTVADRFYVIRRLKKVFQIVNQLHLYDFVFDGAYQKMFLADPLEELSTIVENQSVQAVIQRMITEKNISPLLDLFSEVQRFKHVNDERFFQEVLMTIFAAYKKILLSDQFSEEYRIEIEDELDTILHLYENLETLSTDELLTSIDMATDHMGLLFQEIEQNKNEWSITKLPAWAIVATLAACTSTAAYLLVGYR